MSRPFKVWTADRRIRRSLTAVSLVDLIAKGKEKLNLVKGEKVEVVLESDGTLVDDEDYFQHLESNTTLLLLKHNECWSASWTEDSVDSDHVDGKDEVDGLGPRTMQQIAALLRGDVARIALLAVEELELVVGAPSSTLVQLLDSAYTLSEINRLQAACQRYIDERADARETAQLVRLISERTQHADSGDCAPVVPAPAAGSRKRMRRK